MAEKPNILGIITKSVFIGGAVILFAILAYLIITLVPKAISGISNLGSSFTNTLKSGKEIQVQTNESEITSGSPFALSWEYNPQTPGEFYISYSCDDSLIMDIKSVEGPKRILCNTQFRLGENVDSIFLIPTISKKNIFVDTNITITYKDFENKKQVAYGDTVVTLKNIAGSTTSQNPYSASLSGSTVESKLEENKGLFGIIFPNANTNTNTTNTPANYGKPDLQISSIRTNGESALSFNVQNNGTASSGGWYFSYTDAENPTRTLQSPLQFSIAPKQTMLVNVRFDDQRNNSQNINIYIDSTNSVNESNETNNSSSVTIYGDRNSNSNDYNEDDEADLIIEDFEVGRMSGSRFVEDDSIDEDDTAAIRFVVKNNGGESTGDWKYEITHTPNDDDFKSGRQSSLRPGEEETITVEFENPDHGTYNIKLEVDSDDDVDEEKENNNTKYKELEIEN